MRNDQNATFPLGNGTTFKVGNVLKLKTGALVRVTKVVELEFGYEIRSPHGDTYRFGYADRTVKVVPVKVVRHKFEGEVVEGEYEVHLDGCVGHIRRNDGISNGYYGRWRVGTWGTDTRASAVTYVIDRHIKRQEAAA